MDKSVRLSKEEWIKVMTGLRMVRQHWAYDLAEKIRNQTSD